MLNSIPSSLDNSQTEPQKTNETTSSQNCNNTQVVCSLSSSKNMSILCLSTNQKITLPIDSEFGTLRFQFEVDNIIKEYPISPSMLFDFFVKRKYQLKESNNC